MGEVPLELHSRVAVMCRLVFRTATWTGARFVESCVPGYAVRPAHNCDRIARQHSARRGMKWQQWGRPRVAKNGAVERHSTQ